MIKILKPNTYCKNRDCNKGTNGERNFYYSCKHCVNQAHFKTVACCIECYGIYMTQVEEARKSGKVISKKEVVKPVRIDMNDEQYEKLMNTPSDIVKEESIKEIEDAGYGETLSNKGFSKTMDIINKDIKTKQKRNKSDV